MYQLSVFLKFDVASNTIDPKNRRLSTVLRGQTVCSENARNRLLAFVRFPGKECCGGREDD